MIFVCPSPQFCPAEESTTSRSSLASQPATVAAMFDLFRLWCGAVIRIFRAHRSLMLENLALRQQLAVLKRKHPRPRLRAFDKLFWVVVRHLWSDWEKSLLLVLPERVARRHQAGFKRYWTMLCKVQKRVGGGGRISGSVARIRSGTT